jgi:hypothetical protein
VKQPTRFYPRLEVDTAPCASVAQAGGVMLTDTIAVTGLAIQLRAGLAPWRKDLAVHDPAKVLLDLALTVALGGEHLSDVAVLRGEPGLYGPVASDPTISRTIDALAADVDAALAAIDGGRAAARAVAWGLAGADAPDHEIDAQHPVVIDLDATLVTAHSDKESAAKTWKKGYGFHPLCAFLDHGIDGTGEPLGIRLRAGNAGSNTAADHIAVTKQALAQLPTHRPGVRPGKRVLVRTDGAGASYAFMNYLHAQRVSYSIGYTLPTDTAELLKKIPESVWTPAYNADGEVRDGAWVAELTGLLDLAGWPQGMRVITRKERPHPGAQLRITDIDGLRVTAFATNAVRGQLPDLELRHRRRARCEDRIRNTKDTGLRALPLHDFAQNQIWCAVLALAGDIVAWMQMLALSGTDARKWEPKRLRMRLYSVPAALARSGRSTRLHLADKAPWAHLVENAITRLRNLTDQARPALAVPG